MRSVCATFVLVGKKRQRDDLPPNDDKEGDTVEQCMCDVCLYSGVNPQQELQVYRLN